MNKTISINIAGFVFNIEDHAYEKLNHYLSAIKSNFHNETERDEIMEDIEARIAELFQEKLSDRKEVIIESDVEEIIEVMGKPEDYLSDEEPIPNQSENQNSFTEEDKNWYNNTKSKRLYRDESDAVVGGVCSGLAYYVNVDPILIRIAFVILTLAGGSGVLLYIILWIVIPSAKTTAEFLEMKGEPVTLDSIKDHIKDARTNIIESTKGAKKTIKNVVDKGVRVGSRVGQILSKVLGIGFVAWGVFLLIILCVILFGGTGIFPIFNSEHIEDLPTLLSLVYTDGRIPYFFIAIAIVGLIPLISLIMTGIKMILGIRVRYKKVSLIFGLIWFIAFAVLVLINVELGLKFKERVEIDYEVSTQNIASDTLYIDISKDNIFSNHIEFNDVINFAELVKVDNDDVYLGFPKIEVSYTTDTSDFVIILHKESNGYSNKDAIQRAEKIEYNLQLGQNKLMLAPYFKINKNDKYRGQTVFIEIQIPKGKIIEFSNNIDRVLVDVENNYYRYSQNYAGTTWMIDEYNDLTCIGCDSQKRIHHYSGPGADGLETLDELEELNDVFE
jgi:phage shock protein PspC (stress-responsive transcriptional regulator)